MINELEKINNISGLNEISFFIHRLEKVSCKEEVANALLETLSTLLLSGFSSFVEKENDTLKVTCQFGDGNSNQKIKNIFNKEISKQLFDWVVRQKKIASLKLACEEQFLFVPLVDNVEKSDLVHGILVFDLLNPNHEFTKELTATINIFVRLAVLTMTKLLKNSDKDKYLKLQDQMNLEMKLTTKLQKSICGVSKNLLFSVLGDKKAIFYGNIWWVSDLSSESTSVLVAKVHCKGLPSAVLGGYLLGEIDSIKANEKIILTPQEVLKYLNKQLNLVFKDTAISANAWYGVFNNNSKTLKFASANHPDPFLIGPEQQVSNLVISDSEKGQPLGVNLNSNFKESKSYISNHSKLIICTQDLLEQASKLGDKYDPMWLPQVLETLGNLSIAEMRNSLECILSEHNDGTAPKGSRLALLLAFP